jgi:hypothetical protein
MPLFHQAALQSILPISLPAWRKQKNPALIYPILTLSSRAGHQFGFSLVIQVQSAKPSPKIGPGSPSLPLLDRFLLEERVCPEILIPIVRESGSVVYRERGEVIERYPALGIFIT